MSCKICNIHKGEFKSEHDYIAIRRKITALVSDGHLKLIKQDDKGPFYIYEYQCTQCKQNWLFSVPDQAFRGGWKRI